MIDFDSTENNPNVLKFFHHQQELLSIDDIQMGENYHWKTENNWKYWKLSKSTAHRQIQKQTLLKFWTAFSVNE